MALAHRWANRSLSKLELAAAVIVIGTLMAVFVGRGLQVFAAAEKQAVQATILNVNSALRILFYRMIINRQMHEAILWRGANPFVLMETWGTAEDVATAVEHPVLARFGAMSGAMGAHYIGEFDVVDPAVIDGGTWYFDRRDTALVYRVRNREFFRSTLPGPARIRYRLEVYFDDLNRDGAYNSDSEVISDVKLTAMEKFSWIDAEGKQ